MQKQVPSSKIQIYRVWCEIVKIRGPSSVLVLLETKCGSPEIPSPIATASNYLGISRDQTGCAWLFAFRSASVRARRKFTEQPYPLNP